MTSSKAAVLSLLVLVTIPQETYSFTPSIADKAWHLWTVLAVGGGTFEITRAYNCMNTIDAVEELEESKEKKEALEVLHENLRFFSFNALWLTTVPVVHLSYHESNVLTTILKAVTCANIAGEAYLLARYVKKQIATLNKKKIA